MTCRAGERAVYDLRCGDLSGDSLDSRRADQQRLSARAMTPRVAILRGEALNPYELQSYAPLLASYDVFGIGAAGGLYDLSPIRVPVVRLRQNGRGRVARRLLGDRAGRLRGLDRVLSQCAIVHSAETFLPISEQAAELRAKHGFKLALTCWENIPFRHDEDKRLSARKRAVRGAADVFRRSHRGGAPSVADRERPE